MKKIICIIASLICSTILFSLFYWGVAWSNDIPFDKLGIVAAYISLLDFSHIKVFADYVMLTLLLIGSLISQGILFAIFYVLFDSIE